jgi:hypothetical protein
VDTRANISTQGSVTAPSLVVPSGVTKIKKIIASAGADGLAVGSSVFFIRIGGSAVKRGEQNIMVGAAGTIACQAGADSAPQVGGYFILEDADIEVNSSDTLTIGAEIAGSDLGTGRIVVTLMFE